MCVEREKQINGDKSSLIIFYLLNFDILFISTEHSIISSVARRKFEAPGTGTTMLMLMEPDISIYNNVCISMLSVKFSNYCKNSKVG